MVYGVRNLIDTISMRAPDIRSHDRVINLTSLDENSRFDLASTQFNIAVGFSANTVIPPSIGYIEALFTVYGPPDASGNRKKERKSLTLEKCNADNWSINKIYKNQLEDTINSLYCVNEEEFK